LIRNLQGNDAMATIENVFAVIEGEEEPDRYVILGNHRDAWTSPGRAAPGPPPPSLPPVLLGFMFDYPMN